MQTDKKTLKRAIKEAGVKFPLIMACFHTGTSICTIQHPEYGKHRLTVHQMKYADGEYKSRLWKDMVDALAADIDMFGFDNSMYFKMLNPISQKNLQDFLKN